jgi:hypothetical protein
VESCDNATVRLDLENEPQPDGFLRILPQCGGQSRNDDEYVGGAPELVAEIAVSSVSIDLHKKLRVYQRNGVREYLVWRVSDSAIDWFGLRGGQFERLPPGETGRYRSEVFPGLWLDEQQGDCTPSGKCNLKRFHEMASHNLSLLLQRCRRQGHPASRPLNYPLPRRAAQAGGGSLYEYGSASPPIDSPADIAKCWILLRTQPRLDAWRLPRCRGRCP